MHAYEQVAEELAREITDGVWRPGTALPTITELAERFGVSSMTIRGGLRELTQRGLVYTGYLEGRRGTIVRTQGRINHYATDVIRTDRNDRSKMAAFVTNAARVGRQPSVRFEMRIEVPPSEIADRLGCALDELVVVRMVYQLLDGEPWSRETGYYPRDIAAELELDQPYERVEGTMNVIAKSRHREISHVDEVIYETAGPKDAKDLGVAIGAPLLVQLRTAANAERVTRVMSYVRIAERNRLIWELGDAAGIEVIQRTRDRDQ